MKKRAKTQTAVEKKWLFFGSFSAKWRNGGSKIANFWKGQNRQNRKKCGHRYSPCFETPTFWCQKRENRVSHWRWCNEHPKIGHLQDSGKTGSKNGFTFETKNLILDSFCHKYIVFSQSVYHIYRAGLLFWPNPQKFMLWDQYAASSE